VNHRKFNGLKKTSTVTSKKIISGLRKNNNFFKRVSNRQRRTKTVYPLKHGSGKLRPMD